MFASLSIYGLYTYSDTIFDNLNVPDGMDKSALITQILTDCSDFALIYPNFDFMKMLIGVWSTKEQKIWENLYKSENIEYNPIENYDRKESISRVINSSAEGTSKGTAVNTSGDKGETTTGQTAYDSDSFKDTSRVKANSNSNSQSVNSETVENNSRGTETVINHAHGNIGVTTAQQMIEGFREVSKFCTYDYIVQSFKDRFCVQVF